VNPKVGARRVHQPACRKNKELSYTQRQLAAHRNMVSTIEKIQARSRKIADGTVRTLDPMPAAERGPGRAVGGGGGRQPQGTGRNARAQRRRIPDRALGGL